MRNFFILLIIPALLGFSEKEPVGFYRVEIYQGGTSYGLISLKLLEEGLVCRNNYFLTKHKKNKLSIFIPVRKIDPDSWENLQVFLIKNNGFSDFKREYKKEKNGFRNVYIIKKEIDQNSKIIIDFEKKDQKLDSLRILMNELIPRKYKKDYSLDKYYKLS